MKWLTISQIKRRSKTAKGALKVSYEHWNQLYTATAKELRGAIVANKVNVGNEFCGLCTYHDDKCSVCVLGQSDGSCYNTSGTAYSQARHEFAKQEYQEIDRKWHTWKRACKALRDKHKELMESK